MVDRTKQTKLEEELKTFENEWLDQGVLTKSCQHDLRKATASLKDSKQKQDKAFKAFQKKKGATFIEKQKNDRLHWKEKLKERQKETKKTKKKTKKK